MGRNPESILGSCQTLQLDYQKLVGKGFVYTTKQKEWTYVPSTCPRMAVLHVRDTVGGGWSYFMLTFGSASAHINDDDCDISRALKWDSVILDYPVQGIPIDCIDTHSL